ncbi:MAG: polyprenyl synthetase family protein [Gemmatimonadota bacterium]
MSRGVASGFDTGAFLRLEREAVAAALERVLEEALADSPAAVADPIRYAVGSGGKRIRPIFCVAAFRSVRGGGSRRSRARAAARAPRAPVDATVRELAAAIELIHSYSLVHDDLPCMDDDDLRRGRPSTHRAFDVERAMIAGAALIPLAVGAADRAASRMGIAATRRVAIARELTRAAGADGMVGGQFADLEAEGGGETEIAALEAIHVRKTGALLGASLRIGALAAGAGAAVLDALGEFGRAVGLAFQVTDDVLDVIGTDDVLGKTAGKDEVTSKATYPALLGVDGARARARDALDRGLTALHDAGILTAELEALARFTVERDR